MGKPESLQKELQRFITEALKARLALDSNYTVIDTVSGGMKAVRWMGGDRLRIDFSENVTWRNYLQCIVDRQYNILLEDYSFIQIFYLLNRGQIIKNRLVYYPCPIIIERGEIEEFGIADFFDVMTEKEILERIKQGSILRFEYDSLSASVSHPASHLHVNQKSCRIPVCAPLSLGRFIRFVFHHFYPTAWERHAFLRRWPCLKINRCITNADGNDLHLAWEQTGSVMAVAARTR